LEVGSVPWEV
jgi:hypothetical protein